MKTFLVSSIVAFSCLSMAADMAQARTTILDCKGVDNKKNSIEFSIIKKVPGRASNEIALSFSLKAQGTIDGETGTLSGKASFDVPVPNVRPNEVSPIYQKFSVDDNLGNKASLVNLSRLTSDVEVPGSLLSMQVKTNNSQIPLLKIKGIIGNFVPGDKKMMNANVYISDGSQSQSLANSDLNCVYSINE